MFMKHMQNRVRCFQASVLHLFHTHVPFPRYHSTRATATSLSPVGVDANNVAVARVLGMPDSATTIGAYYSSVARVWGT